MRLKSRKMPRRRHGTIKKLKGGKRRFGKTKKRQGHVSGMGSGARRKRRTRRVRSRSSGRSGNRRRTRRVRSRSSGRSGRRHSRKMFRGGKFWNNKISLPNIFKKSDWKYKIFNIDDNITEEKLGIIRNLIKDIQYFLEQDKNTVKFSEILLFFFTMNEVGFNDTVILLIDNNDLAIDIYNRFNEIRKLVLDAKEPFFKYERRQTMLKKSTTIQNGLITIDTYYNTNNTIMADIGKDLYEKFEKLLVSNKIIKSDINCLYVGKKRYNRDGLLHNVVCSSTGASDEFLNELLRLEERNDEEQDVNSEY